MRLAFSWLARRMGPPWMADTDLQQLSFSCDAANRTSHITVARVETIPRSGLKWRREPTCVVIERVAGDRAHLPVATIRPYEVERAMPGMTWSEQALRHRDNEETVRRYPQWCTLERLEGPGWRALRRTIVTAFVDADALLRDGVELDESFSFRPETSEVGGHWPWIRFLAMPEEPPAEAPPDPPDFPSDDREPVSSQDSDQG
jgi:hypothetical protein